VRTNPWRRRVSPIFFVLLVVLAAGIAFVAYALLQAVM